jgi:hypothetical protein
MAAPPSPKRLAISDPRYNLREIAKQMILLEQHLLEPKKYCPDCISKHLLTIEALAEEAQCLDTHQQYSELLGPIVRSAKQWAAAYAAGTPVKQIGQAVRRIRKPLAPRVLSPLASLAPIEVAAITGEFSGVSATPSRKTAEWQVWAVLAGSLALGALLVERNRRST